MKQYQKLEMDIISLNNEDVLTASGSCCRPESEIMEELCTCYPNNPACQDR